jgi:hypothetical protein
MTFDDLYPSRFVKAADLQGKDVTKTITSVKQEELESENGKKVKVIVTFANSKKQWVAPVTCGLALKLMFGDKVQGWIGKRVTLFGRQVESFGEMVDAIRVRGSPDIPKPMNKSFRRGRKTITVNMIPTGTNGKKTPVEEELEEGFENPPSFAEDEAGSEG